VKRGLAFSLAAFALVLSLCADPPPPPADITIPPPPIDQAGTNAAPPPADINPPVTPLGPVPANLVPVPAKPPPPADVLPRTYAGGTVIGPGPGYQVADEPKQVSPDGQVEVWQYFKPGDDYVFQFWTFDRHRQHAHQLNPHESGSLTSYGASFRFSPNSRWLVRMQKIAAGESTLFLYQRQGLAYVPATPKPLGDMAWDFFYSQPEAKGVDRNNLSPEVNLVKGLDTNYAWMGEHWPDSRYIVIGLGSGESGTTPIGPWHCVYDTQSGTFSIPPDIAAFNQSKMPWK
jgi:hypothetical protein